MKLELEFSMDEKGFNIIEVFENIWVFEVIDGQSYYGNLREVVLLAIHNHDFSFHDIELAINSMIREEHNAAHFGIFKTLIYTFNQPTPKSQMAS
jgi:hypothetical protein